MAKQMRKVRVGSVVGTRMDRTAVVEMVWKQRHRLYRKQMRRVARFYIHDPENQCQVGDTVRIQETRPISKTKHWRLLEILQSRQVAEVSKFRRFRFETVTNPSVGSVATPASCERCGKPLITRSAERSNDQRPIWIVDRVATAMESGHCGGDRTSPRPGSFVGSPGRRATQWPDRLRRRSSRGRRGPP